MFDQPEGPWGTSNKRVSWLIRLLALFYVLVALFGFVGLAPELYRIVSQGWWSELWSLAKLSPPIILGWYFALVVLFVVVKGRVPSRWWPWRW